MILVPILYSKTAKQLSNAGDDGSGRLLDRESRLFFAMIGAPALPIGLFWMGWTDYVSSSEFPLFVVTPAHNMTPVVDFDMVAASRVGSHWVCQHLHLHVGVHVHH